MSFNPNDTSPIYQLQVMDNLLIFVFPVIFVFLLLALYKQIFWLYKLTFRPLEVYMLIIDNLTDFYKHWIKLQLLLLLVFVIFELKLLRRARDLMEIKHIFETLYYFETQLPIILPICGIPIFLLLLVFARLGFLYVLYSIKMLFLRLHLYFLQIHWYDSLGSKLSALPNKYYFFYYDQLIFWFKKVRIAKFGFAIHQMSIILEKYLYNFGVMFCYFFDYLTNFGVTYVTMAILPYYFIYNLSRKCLITWYNWFEDDVYFRISSTLYEETRVVNRKTVISFFAKISSVLWSQVVLITYFFIYFGIYLLLILLLTIIFSFY